MVREIAGYCTVAGFDPEKRKKEVFQLSTNGPTLRPHKASCWHSRARASISVDEYGILEFKHSYQRIKTVAQKGEGGHQRDRILLSPTRAEPLGGIKNFLKAEGGWPAGKKSRKKSRWTRNKVGVAVPLKVRRRWWKKKKRGNPPGFKM